MPLKRDTSYLQVVCIVSPFIPHIFIDVPTRHSVSVIGYHLPDGLLPKSPLRCVLLPSYLDAVLSSHLWAPSPPYARLSSLLVSLGLHPRCPPCLPLMALGRSSLSGMLPPWGQCRALFTPPSGPYAYTWTHPGFGLRVREALESQQSKVDMLVARNFKRLFQQVVLSSLTYIESQARSYSQSVSLYCFQENKKVYQSMYGQM